MFCCPLKVSQNGCVSIQQKSLRETSRAPAWERHVFQRNLWLACQVEIQYYRLLDMLSNVPILTLRSRGSSHRSHWRPTGKDTNETSHSVRWISCAGNVLYTSVADANRLARRCCYLCLVNAVRSSDVCFQLNVHCCQFLFSQTVYMDGKIPCV